MYLIFDCFFYNNFDLVSIFKWLIDNYLQVIATISGIGYVLLAAKQNIWCWFLGLINVILLVVVYYSSQLYASVVLQFLYLIITVYGWYKWYKGSEDGQQLPVTKLNKKHYYTLSAIFVVCVGVSYYILKDMTDDPLPFWDSITSVGGIICTYLAARKILENWLIWIFIDAIATAVCLYMGLYALAVLYLIYFIMAFYGYFQWKKTLINN